VARRRKLPGTVGEADVVGEDRDAKLESAVLEAAAYWITRIHDPAVTAADIAAHRSWLAAHASHAAAFDRLEDVWRRLEIARRHVGDYGEATPQVEVMQCQGATDLKTETDGTSNL
jgi:ferric-dicitrate binding protein FerR (iron transport regulator)